MTRWIIAVAVVVGALHTNAEAQVFKPRTKLGPAKAIVAVAKKGEKVASPEKAAPIATKKEPAKAVAAPAKKTPAKRPAKKRPANTEDDDVMVVDDDEDDE